MGRERKQNSTVKERLFALQTSWSSLSLFKPMLLLLLTNFWTLSLS